ncbi:MAG: DUF3325 family protein [Pseudomonadota bacterium]
MVLISSIAILAGNLCICFAMRRHELMVFKARLADSNRLALRVVGGILLFIGAILVSIAEGAFIGLTLWFALFTLAMLGTAFSLAIVKS